MNIKEEKKYECFLKMLGIPKYMCTRDEVLYQLKKISLPFERERDIAVDYYFYGNSKTTVGKKYVISGARVGQLCDKFFYKFRNSEYLHTMIGEIIPRYNSEYTELLRLERRAEEIRKKLFIFNRGQRVETLKLHPSVISSLLQAGVKTIQDLLMMSDRDLLLLRGIGKVRLKEIKKIMEENGGQFNG